MSERQLVERICDTCKKNYIFESGNLTQEQITEFEKWFMVASVKHDGHGSFIPVVQHMCSRECAAKGLLTTDLDPPKAGNFATAEAKDMDHFRTLAGKDVN